MRKLASHRSGRPRDRRLGLVLLVVLLILLGGCGKSTESSSATTAPVAAATDDSVPPTEGTGPGPTLPPSHGSSVQVAGLPIGDGHADVNGNDQCVHVFWTGFVEQGNTFAVTGTVESPDTGTAVTATTDTTATSSTGRFVSIDVAAACGGVDPTAPACVGHQFDSTTNPPSGLNCLAGVRWVGGPAGSTETWSLELTGELRCPSIDSAQVCRSTGLPADKQSTTQTSVELTPPTVDAGTSATTTADTAASTPETTSPSETSSP